ncbi:MAG TPA: hypothetical protein VKB09_00850 [Thermomicrobiales bacterium]|nr:hypothetical protein [Thermomicrobiales bacterium]
MPRNPLALRRLGLALILLGAILAGLAAWLRDRLAAGSVGHSATYLLDVAGWFLAIAGAVLEARVGDLLLTARQSAARRRAVLLAVGGLGAALVACATIPLRSSGASASPLRVALAAVLVGGFGLGLGGLATLGWYYGGRYAERRIERMGEDDW